MCWLVGGVWWYVLHEVCGGGLVVDGCVSVSVCVCVHTLIEFTFTFTLTPPCNLIHSICACVVVCGGVGTAVWWCVTEFACLCCAGVCACIHTRIHTR